MAKNRNYQITINNPHEHGITHDVILDFLENNNVKYACGVDEIGNEEKTYHTHLFIIFNNARYIKSVIKMFVPFNNAHVEICRGTIDENIDYIKKENKHDNKKETQVIDSYFEFGDLPSGQGSRNDKEIIYELVNSDYSADEIIDMYPQYIFQFEKIQTLCINYKTKKYENQFRNNIKVTYIYGEAGTGKTSYIFKQHNIKDIYRISNYEHPFDDYNFQSVLVLDEYRSNFTIEFLLNILDKYPLMLPCRFKNKVACFERVYIISNAPLEEQHINIPNHSKEALYRRISDIINMTRNKIYIYSDMDLYKHGIHTTIENEVTLCKK